MNTSNYEHILDHDICIARKLQARSGTHSAAKWLRQKGYSLELALVALAWN